MSTTKKLLPLSLVASLLLFTACGGGGGSTPPQNEDNKDKVTVPQKISIDIPDSLKLNRNTNNINKLSSISIGDSSPAITSYGYQQLQGTISQAEETIENIKENMKYLTLMMPDIIKECSDTAENETCTIPTNVIKLNVEGQVLPMGEILYTKQDKSKKHQQVVILDLKPTLTFMGDLEVEKDLETVKWSTDENHIETISDYKDTNGDFNMHLIYDKENDGASTMTITDRYNFDGMQGNFTLKLDDKNDVNHTVLVETSATSKFQEESNSFSSKGTVDDNGGYLISKGNFEEEAFAEKETFDENGSLIKSTFCHTGDTCDMNEPNTWTNFDYNYGFVDDFDDDSFTDEFPEDIELDFIELNVQGGDINDKFCELLPPTYDSSNLDFDSVIENSIGHIASFDGNSFGMLSTSEYNEQLNTLKIVCDDIETVSFNLLEGDARPTLTIKN